MPENDPYRCRGSSNKKISAHTSRRHITTKSGAHNQSRTGDLFITNEVLYRLSYASKILSQRPSPCIGAGSGNRTRISSLEGWCSTIELYPPVARIPDITPCKVTLPNLFYIPLYSGYIVVEGGGFEPPKLSRQIYSLIPLAAREPLPEEPAGYLFSRVSKAEAAFYGNYLRCAIVSQRFSEIEMAPSAARMGRQDSSCPSGISLSFALSHRTSERLVSGSSCTS